MSKDKITENKLNDDELNNISGGVITKEAGQVDTNSEAQMKEAEKVTDDPFMFSETKQSAYRG